MANITIIPPSIEQPTTLRVAAYCRVSTDAKEQELSYASQIRAYSELISQHEGWEIADIYADDAVSGTKTEKRDDFNRMMDDARKGKIDRILVKSLSRFSRNAKDCLAALRELSKLGVTVYFEKENIDTRTLTTELMVSVSGALAQQESISIAENIRQGYRRRMEQGEFITNKPPYGYRVVSCGDLEIIPEEAEVVRWVFDSYLSGRSLDWIAAEMNQKGVPKKYGPSKWTKKAVKYWLRNEKYTGCTLCQKTFSTGFPFVKKKNQGDLEQFYVEDCHPAIISVETFDKAQALLQQKKVKHSKQMQFPLTRKIICDNCGATFYRQVSSSKRVSWVCSRHIEGKEICPTPSIPEADIYTAFIHLYSKLHLHAGIILQPALNQMEALEAALRRENPAMLELNRNIALATERSHKITKLRNSGLLDADAYAAQMAANNAQLTDLRGKRRKLLQSNGVSETTENLRQTIAVIRQGPEQLAEFDEALFESLVERISVKPNRDLCFHLHGGIELVERLGEQEK